MAVTSIVRGSFHRALDTLVGATAAHVLRQRLADGGAIRLMDAVEEGDRSHDEAGDAIAALHGLFVDEGALYTMQCAVSREAFHRHYCAACRRADLGHARTYGLSIKQDCTGAAHSLPAAVLCAGEACVEPNEAEETTRGIIGLVRCSIDADCDHDSLRCGAV